MQERENESEGDGRGGKERRSSEDGEKESVRGKRKISGKVRDEKIRELRQRLFVLRVC